ncbi:MAG: hypothetical protein HSCHL_1449 [Hydrogenibacillus schlegelii]|uniref:Oligosaccharide repeat unit polymerase n=1 Tax=Hydrogenibacillus schlegelii TaxID=1484 RepID=A0A2T5GC91_HYDSH|nr:hypothetical protein [Hydrogenibacillus schlegelii]PTQ53821.1 MAG: hypothetical protein HSCHL_1449 [Hydrogenibacillus schlegelii]
MDIDSLELTIILAACHALVYAAFLLATFRPAFTFFHLFLVTQAVAFALRPLLAVSQGGFSLYGGTWGSYNLGLAYQLLANALVGIGYLVGYLGLGVPRNNPLAWRTRPLTRALWFSFVFGVSMVAWIHVLSKGAWLPTARSVAITEAVPLGKILFPAAVIPLSVSVGLSGFLLYSALVGSRRRRALGEEKANLWTVFTWLLTLLVSILLLSLLFQRGFVLAGFIVVILLLSRVNKLGYIKLGILGILALLVLTQIRPAVVTAVSLITGTSTETPLDRPSFLLRYFLYAPNFDTIDVWPVAISYTEDRGFLMGSTLLAIPARFMPPAARLAVDLRTGVDTLNEFQWGDRYWETRFGFNITLPQELYINFGLLGFPFLTLAGLVGAFMDRKVWSFPALTPYTFYRLFAAFWVGVPVGEVGGIIQWALAYLLFGLGVEILVKVIIFKPRTRRVKDAHPLSHHPC